MEIYSLSCNIFNIIENLLIIWCACEKLSRKVAQQIGLLFLFGLKFFRLNDYYEILGAYYLGCQERWGAILRSPQAHCWNWLTFRHPLNHFHPTIIKDRNTLLGLPLLWFTLLGEDVPSGGMPLCFCLALRESDT